MKISYVLLALVSVQLVGCVTNRVDTYRHVRSGTDTNGQPFVVEESNETRVGDHRLKSGLLDDIGASSMTSTGVQPQRQVVIVERPVPVVQQPVAYPHPVEPPVYLPRVPHAAYYDGPRVGSAYPSIQFDAGASFNTYGGHYPTYWTQQSYDPHTRRNYTGGHPSRHYGYSSELPPPVGPNFHRGRPLRY